MLGENIVKALGGARFEGFLGDHCGAGTEANLVAKLCDVGAGLTADARAVVEDRAGQGAVASCWGKDKHQLIARLTGFE